MSFIRRLEPLWWMLFGAGGMLGAMLLPGLFFAIAIAFPLGMFGSPDATFVRMRHLAANPVGAVVFGLLCSLVFWHAAHHLRHWFYDVGFHHLATQVSLIAYGLALVGTIAAIGVVSGL